MAAAPSGARRSAETRARWLLLWALVAAAVAAAAWGLLAAGRHVTYEIRSREAVSGLIEGAPVEFHGVQVGHVRSVELLDARSVRVLVEVRRDAPVSSATVATITGRGLAPRGFTGYVYVSLEDRDGPRQALPAGAGGYPRIASAPAQSASLDTSFEQLNQSVQAVTAQLRPLLDPQSVAALKRSIASLDEVSRTLADNNERLVHIVANAEAASRQVQPLLASSDAAMRTLRGQILPQAHAALADIETLSTSMHEQVGVILHNTEQASARIDPLLQSSNEAVRSVQLQLVPQAQHTLLRLDHLSDALEQTTDRIRRNPSLLLRANPGQPGPGEAP